MLDSVIFYSLAGLAVLSAGMMVTRRNAIHSAVYLITTLLATAGIFLQLSAEFLFIVQIILYVGGIMVMFLFVIMLVRLDVALPQVGLRVGKWVSLCVALAVFVEAGMVLWLTRNTPGHGPLPLVGLPAPANKIAPNTEDLAQSLFGSYLLPFEIASILLLVAMIGAVVMGKKRTGTR